MAKKPTSKPVVKPSARKSSERPPNTINQKAGPMADSRTQRDRSRSDQRRNAIKEEMKGLRGYKRSGRGPNGESSN